MYRSTPTDKSWASSGILVRIETGDSVLSIQQRVQETGFGFVRVISMGGEQVFLHCPDGENVMQVFNDAIEFFSMLFDSVHKWNPREVVYVRGAWVRIYGIPVHAWTMSFFELCSKACGKFLKADECSVEKSRLDFARVLVSTSSLEVLNVTSSILVDGLPYTLKFVEELGYYLGENAFLVDNGSDT